MTGYQSKKAAAQAKLDSMEREALKMALEALITITDAIYVNSQQEADAVYKANDAITAIKEALAQPEQEPWRESASDYERGFIDGRQKQAQSSVDKAVNRMAQRPWVGLTAEEAAECWTTSATQTWKNFETKLKEKNNG